MGLVSRFISTPLSRWLQRRRPPSNNPLSDFERVRHELKPGDVLLVEGRSRISDVIKVVTQSPWSHATLYIGRLHDIENDTSRAALIHRSAFAPSTQLVVESQLGTGTLVRALTEYADDHLRICRPVGLSAEDAQTITAHAIKSLGLDYDVRQIFDLARFLFPWGVLPRRWRSSLFRTRAGSETRTVCSTMIAEAFAAVEFPILPLVQRSEQNRIRLYRRNPKLCTPSDFDYSPYFEIIKYPFYDFADVPGYKLLPWTTDSAGAPADAAVTVNEKESPKTE
ncbi:MAG: YiiX/YebB-like N1pC/P60 family cysteine hydrolase [Pseudomonadales bacterium]